MNKVEFNAKLAELKNFGVESVIGEFDGSGDSGYVESITYFNADEEMIYPGTAGIELKEFESYLETNGNIQEYDWWNNEGGWGSFTFDINTGEFKVDYALRLVNYKEEQTTKNIL